MEIQIMTPSSTREDPPEASSFGDPMVHRAVDVDLTLRALADPRRREILCLLDVEPEWTVQELARSLGSVDVLGTDLSAEDAGLVLHHHHLPVLANAGLITTAEDGRRVERGPNFAVVRDMVDAAASVLE